MGYALPTNTDYVSCSWQCHKNRNPPSSEPGTDYASAYGSPLYAPATGRVADRQTSNANATGRFLTIDADDGRRLRSLHLAEIWVNVGDRVTQGQQVGKTGASGYGSDWGYGAHVHETLWATHAYSFCSTCTLDFAKYVGAAPVAGNQRVVGPNPANGRSDPSTTHPATQQLPPGTVADFNGWINGENVQGNTVWFRGAYSGDWFWSGGFTDTGTHDLQDLNTAGPTPTQRVVGPNGANGRGDPSTNGPVTQSLAPGTVANMDGWITGQAVEGNTTWFHGAISGDWFWSGGFTDTGTHDLTDMNSNPPQPPDADNPRGLPAETGFVWPLAAQALNAPLGHEKCEDPSSPYASRGKAGSDTVQPIIDIYAIHWTGTMVDQLDWFSTCNSRSSCPTTYMRRDGWQSQMIRPGAKAATAGPDWNWRLFAVETLAAPGSDFTPEQWEAHAQNIALLAEYDGKTLDGVPVSFTIDRDHVVGHRELDGQSTECPGNAQIAGLDALITRAQEIYDENHPTEPCPPCPECPPTDVLDPATYPQLAGLRAELDMAFGV